MPTDTLTDESPGGTVGEQGALRAPSALAPDEIIGVEFERGWRLPPAPQGSHALNRVMPRFLTRELGRADRDLMRLAARLAATPRRRQRASAIGALALNAAMLTLLAIYGRVHIFVPNKPANSISVVFVDLPPAPVPDLRDPLVAPEPKPEPVPEPEILPEPEPTPAPEPEPPAKPDPLPEPRREPEPPPLDLSPEPEFTRPSEIENAPFIPDAAAASAAAPDTQERPGEIIVDGEQAPAEDAAPLVTVEPQARSARAEEDAGDEKDDDRDEGAGDRADGEQEEREQAPVAAARPLDQAKPSGDDSFDEEPVFTGRRFGLPAVDLPKGDTPAKPGSSGVMAIFCPEEFKDKEKAAECAGRTEIRSGWRPGASGEDFSKAAAVLKQRRKEGDFSDDAVTFGPDIARRAAERARQEDIEDFRRGQAEGLNNAGIAEDPASGTRPPLTPAGAEPSWTRRDDPLVNKKDVDKLRKDLEDAERRNNPDSE